MFTHWQETKIFICVRKQKHKTMLSAFNFVKEKCCWWTFLILNVKSHIESERNEASQNKEKKTKEKRNVYKIERKSRQSFLVFITLSAILTQWSAMSMLLLLLLISFFLLSFRAFFIVLLSFSGHFSSTNLFSFRFYLKIICKEKFKRILLLFRSV